MAFSDHWRRAALREIRRDADEAAVPKYTARAEQMPLRRAIQSEGRVVYWRSDECGVLQHLPLG